MKSWEILLLVYSVVLVLFIVEAVIIFNNKPQDLISWITIIFAVLILMISTYVSKALSAKTDAKLDEVLNRVKRIEERLDGLYKK